MCSLPVHHAGHTGKHCEPSSLAGYWSGLTWVGRAWELGVHGRMPYFHYIASVPGVSAMQPSYKICAHGTIWGSYLCIVYNLFSFSWRLFMHDHWLNWIPFWISAAVFLPCWTVISGTGNTRLRWQGSYLKSYLPGNKLVPTSEQIYQRVLVEHENHLVEALILFYSRRYSILVTKFYSLERLRWLTNWWSREGICDTSWHSTLLHVPEEVNWELEGELGIWGRDITAPSV